MSEIKYICIEGVIGVGKTSLSKKLIERYSGKLIQEEFEINPFLEKFYKEREKYAFQAQMFFLVNRFKQLQFLNQEEIFNNYIISDYAFEKDRIFATVNLSLSELSIYENLYNNLRRELRQPDLVIYLQAGIEKLMYNIKKRGRKMEKNITVEYLQELSNAYNDFFFKYNNTPLLIVNTNEIDFVNNKDDFENLCTAIFKEDRSFIEYFYPSKRF
ncbi:MAG TPA: deoxynucleoside kinase [Melioribacteraceae bacterium]|nr:deoxynucleoside kinase [Melioribacteraceae bacterium]